MTSPTRPYPAQILALLGKLRQQKPERARGAGNPGMGGDNRRPKIGATTRSEFNRQEPVSGATLNGASDEPGSGDSDP
jgi:hypothetical protein